MIGENAEPSIGDLDRHLIAGVLIEIFIGVVPIPCRFVWSVHATHIQKNPAGDSKSTKQ